jgi:hypothetical protein
MSDPSTFMRSGGHFVLFTQTEEAFFGCLPTIEEKVENAWFTTMNGGRFPAAFMDSEEQGWPSISGDCLALESRSDFFERWGKDFEKVKILRLPPVMAKRQGCGKTVVQV